MSYSVAVLKAAVLFSAVLDADAVAQTAVTLTFRGTTEEAVTVTRARLLVTAWGVSEQYELPIDGNVVRIELEATRPEFAERIADTTGFISVKAAGYAPVMSEALTWPTAGVPTVIDFRNGRKVTIARGARASLVVPIRRPLPRRVRLVDLDGRALVGAKVEAAAYWPTPNHCGFFHGRDVLASGSTNGDGTIGVPDVDGPHVFSLLDPHVLFADADNYPTGFRREDLVATLSRPETTLRVRRYQPQRFALDIVSEGKPVSSAVLWSDMGLGCVRRRLWPACNGRFGRSHSGRGLLPEMWRNYWICAGGKQLWVLPQDGKLPARIEVGVAPSGEPDGFANLCEKQVHSPHAAAPLPPRRRTAGKSR